MKTSTRTRMGLTLSLIIASFLFLASAYCQDEIERAKVPFKPSNPPRLYNVPTAYIIPSLDLSVSSGGAFGTKGFGYQGTAGFGLADIAQIEIHAIGIGSNIEERISHPVFAPGFKMMLLRAGKWELSGISSPGISWALRSSLWREDEEGNTLYKTKVADLYFVATEKLGPISLHGGVDIFDARLISNIMERQGIKEVKQNFVRPFGGFDIAITERGKAMAEFGWAADFNYNKDGIQQDSDIEPIWVGRLGVRFFITRYTAMDVGVKYQQNYEGVSDAGVEVKFDTFIPTHLIYERAKK